MAYWRQGSLGDLDGLMRVSCEIHPNLPESKEVFSERMRLFPQGCLVLVHGDEVGGYALSHPIRQCQPPPLNSLLGNLAPDATQYYIHDLAILPKLRGHGLAKAGIEKLLSEAEHYSTTCLISVYGTAPFWARFGFAPSPVDELLRAKLRVYGADSCYLIRQNRFGL